MTPRLASARTAPLVAEEPEEGAVVREWIEPERSRPGRRIAGPPDRSADDPGLGQLVDDDDDGRDPEEQQPGRATGRPRRRARPAGRRRGVAAAPARRLVQRRCLRRSRIGPRHSLAVGADPAQGEPDRPGVELDRRRRARPPAAGPARDRVGQRLGGDAARYGASDRRAAASSQTSIRSSSSSSASRRRSWIARWSSRASPSARSSWVSSVSMTTTSPSSWATAVPGPRRGQDLDLVGGQGHARRAPPSRRAGSRTRRPGPRP